MDLFQRILECDEEEVDSILEEAIKEADKNAQPVSQLGFLDYGKSNSVFQGFIPLKTRIKYANLNIEDYGMETTDFIYEFAHFIKKYKIGSKGSLIYSLEYFINHYFDFPGKVDRETIFNDIAWQTTTTDEEFFKALSNNKIGDLKGKGAAECTERGALAQQIISIFGTEVYYCMGCVDLDGRQEAHCFNIVKRKNDYALLDYSIPITSYDEEKKPKSLYPFVGVLTKGEFLDFINGGMIKSFDDYSIIGKSQEKTGRERRYIIGKYEILKEDKNAISNK